MKYLSYKLPKIYRNIAQSVFINKYGAMAFTLQITAEQ